MTFIGRQTMGRRLIRTLVVCIGLWSPLTTTAYFPERVAPAFQPVAARSGFQSPAAASRRDNVDAEGRDARPGEADPGLPIEAYRRVAVWTSDPTPAPLGFFLEPHGLTVDPFDNSVWLADSDNNRIQHLAADGRPLGALGGAGALPAGLLDPRDVAIEGSTIFVSDYGHDRVAVFDDTGAYRGEWPSLDGPWGIAAASDGRVFVALNRTSEVAVFEPNGKRLATWGGLGDGFGQLNRPQGLDVAADGRLFVADTGNSQVKVLDKNGGRQIRESRPDPFAPLDLALDPQGDLYVLYADGAVRRHLDSTGLPADPRGWLVPGGNGLAASPDGSLLVAFQDDNRPKSGVARLAGRPLMPAGEWGGVPAPLGRLAGPTRLAAGADGAWIADSLRRAQRFDGTGKALTQLGTGIINDLVPRPGGGLTVVRDAAVAAIGAAGNALWTVTPTVAAGAFSWLAAAADDDAAGGVAVIDLGEQRVRRYGAGGQPAGGFAFGDPSSPTTTQALWDLAVTPAGYAMVNRQSAEIEIRRRDQGTVLAHWPVPGAPLRVATDGAGLIYVLNRFGWVWKYKADGALLAVWPAGDPADVASAPSDLAVDAGGRVLVVDPGLDRVEVFALDPALTPGEVPTFSPHCAATGDKLADPTALTLGERTTITLRVSGGCPAQRTPLDIMLAVDVSGSMLEPADALSGQSKLDAAKQAARQFASQVDFGSDHVGLVSFNQSPLLVRQLTGNPAALLAGIEQLAPGGGTDIAAGIEEARRELSGPRRRPPASGVIVLLTDGMNNRGAPPVIAVAGKASLEGLRLITIAFGQGADVDLLQRIASGPRDFYAAPDAASLTRAYRDIAQRLAASVLFQRLLVTDDLPANMRFVPGSANVPPQVSGQRLTWALDDVPLSGQVLSYQVEPLEAGRWPTNVEARGEGRDGLDQPGAITFPVPVVTVSAPTPTLTALAPSPTPTPTATPTPKPTATPRPPDRRIFLPLLLRQTCSKLRQHVDVVLVIDTSLSMNEPDPSGGTKLEAAVAAATRFVGLLDHAPPGADRAAIVAFNSSAAIRQPLTSDAGAVVAALGRLAAGPGTRIDLGLVRAGEALAAVANPEHNVPVVILLTDGRPSGTTDVAVIAAADGLKAARATLYAIGLGSDVDADLLGRIASSPATRVLAPTAAELAAIYASIAHELPCLGS